MAHNTVSQNSIDDFFVCIGAQKAGTTWLASVLARHPEVFFTPVKEIHYFDSVHLGSRHLSEALRAVRLRKFYRRLAANPGRLRELAAQRRWYRDYRRGPIDDAWYVRLFDRAHRGSAWLAGEATPEYAALGQAGLTHLSGLAPRARLLFIMREPVARAWSAVQHHCRRRRVRAEALTVEAVDAIVNDAEFVQLGDYAATLSALAAVFGPAQVWLGFHEDLHEDRQAAIEGICGFLSIPAAPLLNLPLGRRVNRSRNVEPPAAVRAHLREICRPTVDAVAARLGRVPDVWLREFD
ncbi:MAG: sulfotransferase [Chromatiales bacterium]|nr:sulfotransferase [Chromatiales bacterium]